MARGRGGRGGCGARRREAGPGGPAGGDRRRLRARAAPLPAGGACPGPGDDGAAGGAAGGDRGRDLHGAGGAGGGLRPGLRRFLLVARAQGRVTTERLAALLAGIGVEISKRQVVRLLTSRLDDLLAEDRDVLRAGLATARWVTVVLRAG